MNGAELTHLEESGRWDRSYDEQSPSTILHPNGSRICSYDRPFIAAAMREVLRLYEWKARHDGR